MPRKNTGKTESHHDRDLLLETFDKENSSTFENENDLRLDNSSGRRSKSEGLEKNKESHEMANVSFFKRLLCCAQNKKVIGAFLGLSFIFHFLVINSVYRMSQPGEIVEPARHKITSKIRLIEDHETPKDPQAAEPTPQMTKKPFKTIKPAKFKTVRPRKLSSDELVALGKKHMSKAIFYYRFTL